MENDEKLKIIIDYLVDLHDFLSYNFDKIEFSVNINGINVPLIKHVNQSYNNSFVDYNDKLLNDLQVKHDLVLDKHQQRKNKINNLLNDTDFKLDSLLKKVELLEKKYELLSKLGKNNL